MLLGLPIILALLPCINFNEPLYQHIHVKMDPVPPGGIGTQGCFREIHTHFADGWLHLESTEPKNFTLGDFYELWGKNTTGIVKIKINGLPADFDTVLKDRDKVVIN